jgi:hypothetical protein
MNKQDVLTLFEYNYWAYRRFLRAAARVRPEGFAAPAHLSHGSPKCGNTRGVRLPREAGRAKHVEQIDACLKRPMKGNLHPGHPAGPPD